MIIDKSLNLIHRLAEDITTVGVFDENFLGLAIAGCEARSV